jgi:hypothetical protein
MSAPQFGKISTAQVDKTTTQLLANSSRFTTKPNGKSSRKKRGTLHKQGRYPAPSQPTFSRCLQKVDGRKLEEVILAVQEQVRGQPPQEDLIALDGKEPKHGGGQGVLTAVSLPSQFYLGSEIVEEKTNEIPVAPQLLQRLDLQGRLVSLDALNTQDQTARAVVMEGGGDYLLTAKGNQPTVEANIQKLVPAPQADFPP